MIRQLTADEVPLTLEGAHEFYTASKMPGVFNDDVYIKTWSSIIASNRGTILIDVEGDKIIGAIAGVLSPNMFTGDMMAIECFWFVFPEHRGHGIRLLKAYEYWAASRDVKLVCMVHLKGLQPESLKALYERMGYHEIETNYLKEAA